MTFASTCGAAFAAAIMCASGATALPVQWKVEDGGNGHFYEYVVSDSKKDRKSDAVTFDYAQSIADSLSYQGMQGYLLTLTSQQEQDFVLGTASTIASYLNGNENFWLGAKGSARDMNSWVWDQGDEAGQKINDIYSNWMPSGRTVVRASSAGGTGRAVLRGSNGGWSPFPYGERSYVVVEYSPLPVAEPLSSVPLPGALPLMVGGLAVGGALAWRNRRKASSQG